MAESNHTTITGTISHITFYSEESGYVVMQIKQDAKKAITAVGIMPGAHQGEQLVLQGSWITDKRYGEQFRFTSFTQQPPTTMEAVIEFLSSGLIKGIGKSTAERITAKFGTNTLNILETAPERLAEVSGIGTKRAKLIAESYQTAVGVKKVFEFLAPFDISAKIAAKVYQTYKEQAVAVLQENPYKLADDVYGLGFIKADEIAMKLGFAKDNPLRCKAGLVYCVKLFEADGHAFATPQQLKARAQKLLKVSTALLEQVEEELYEDGSLIPDGDAVYLPVLYEAEKTIADRLTALYLRNNVVPIISPKTAQTSSADDVQYDETQRRAIQTALQSMVFVLTGGPGTGKTTTVKGILNECERLKLEVRLAAPTGRAAKRLAEVTNQDAVTIHRLLEYNPELGWQRNADNPLEGDVLIVDEASMIDTYLMAALTEALPDNMHLILVGDTDQLPSVGPGRVMGDIIDSGAFPVVHLDKIFRQAQGSRIITNAHAINHGTLPDISNHRMPNGAYPDFYFLPAKTDRDAVTTVLDLATHRLPKAYKIGCDDIQVLTPMKKGDVGSIALNKQLQRELNGVNLSRGGVKYGDTIFALRDRVMQIKNNYDTDVYNGDLGTVIDIDRINRTVTVEFAGEGKQVTYEHSELDELMLAYACTIHKSQGSEYPVVVIPLLGCHYRMLQRNLIYTAITRAQRLCIIVGNRDAIVKAVSTATVSHRNTQLVDRLRQTVRTYKQGGNTDHEEPQTSNEPKYEQSSLFDAAGKHMHVISL